MIREGIFTKTKYLSVSSLQTYYLNIDSSSYSGRKNERENLVQTKCTFCGGPHPTEKYFKYIIKDKDKACVAGDYDRKRTERPPRNFFRCGYVDNIIAKFPKTPKDNDKR